MTNNILSKPLKIGVYSFTMLFFVGGLSGCSGLGKALGAGKNPPNEFEVVRQAPLIIPPDYNLRPPRPGMERPNKLNSRKMAIQALFPDRNPNIIATPGELALIRAASATNTDNAIRQNVATEEMIVADRGVFAGDILFAKKIAKIKGVSIERKSTEITPE